MKKEEKKGFINKKGGMSKEEWDELLNTKPFSEDDWKNFHDQKDKLNKSKCYIATMAYGDINHPKVETLRRYRDNVLINKRLGILFINYYYKFSPFLVSKLKNYRRINLIIRRILDFLISRLDKS